METAAALPRFARTKIQAPRPRGGALITRASLESRLRAALLSQRLVLVCAAAGYGKTAALARQGASLPEGTAFAWVATDEGDDLQRLLDCLFAALDPFDPPWRHSPDALVSAAGSTTAASRQALAAEVLNALDACELAHGVIVLEDLHRVSDPAVFDFLELLIERLSPHWTIAISSRHEPPLPLARWRARGELGEFRQADLQFARDEVQTLLAPLGLGEAVVERVLQRTQGWPAGLRLAMSTQHGTDLCAGTTAVDRHAFDFLASEVLDQLPEELRNFLLRCSVLSELTATRCAAVSGNARAAQLLDEIERRGLFVSPLGDEDERVLVLHDLFRDALQHRLALDKPSELTALLRHAAAGEADPVRLVGLLLRAGDLDEAANVLLKRGRYLLTEGAVATVRRLVGQFPTGHAERCADLKHVEGLVAWATWDFNGMLAATRRAEELYAAAGDEVGTELMRAYQAISLNALGFVEESNPLVARLRRTELPDPVRVVVLVACAWHALEVGSLNRIGPILGQLLDVLERQPRVDVWYQTVPLQRFHGLRGTSRPLQRFADGVLHLFGETPTSLRATALVQLGWRHLWRGQFTQAEEALQRARADSQWVGEPINVRSLIHALAAMLHALRGEREAAVAEARARVAMHPPGRGPWALWILNEYAARVAVACGDTPLLRESLREMTALQSVELVQRALQRTPLHHELPGHLAWYEGRAEEACALWQTALAHEAQIDGLGTFAHLRVWLAHGLLSLGRRAEAAQILQPVFERVMEDGEPGGVLLAPRALPALADADWGALLDPAQCRMLQDWRALGAPLQAGTPPEARSTGAPFDAGLLSPREAEVLERIAAGDSNKLIARAFDLSPHTVKRHVANILDKLGLASRGQAAAWWRSHA